MKLVMAISIDNFIAKHEADPMDWLGPVDKKVFRIMTGVGGICAAGRVTAELMPGLIGRRVITLTRNGMTLDHVAGLYPNAWLLGGQTVAINAFLRGYIDEVHLCRSPMKIFNGIPEMISPWLKTPVMKTRLDEYIVEVYRANQIRKEIGEVI
jgi:dihydrofolate reductase